MESKKKYKLKYKKSRNRLTGLESKLLVTKGEREEGQLQGMGLTDRTPMYKIDKK